MSETPETGIQHPTETLTCGFDGDSIEVEVYSPQGWTPTNVNPTGCSWQSADGQHTAQHYVDDVKGGTITRINNEVVATGLTKREAATQLSEWQESQGGQNV